MSSVFPNFLRMPKASDVFDTEDAAMAAGYSRFGAGGFLIKEILRRDLEIIQRWPQTPSASASTNRC